MDRFLCRHAARGAPSKSRAIAPLLELSARHVLAMPTSSRVASNHLQREPSDAPRYVRLLPASGRPLAAIIKTREERSFSHSSVIPIPDRAETRGSILSV
jgi:hypothetical protein